MKGFFFFLIFFCIGIILFFLWKEVSIIHVSEGTYTVEENYIVKKYQTLIIDPGVKFLIDANVRFIINGRIIARGTTEKPIMFISKNRNTFWRGIVLNGEQKLDIPFYKEKKSVEKIFDKNIQDNILSYCVFSGLATNKKFDVANRKKAVIESYGANLSIDHTSFKDVIYMGGIQVSDAYFNGTYNVFNSESIKTMVKFFHLINSIFILDHNIITPKTHHKRLWADGIYSNMGIGIISNNIFDGLTDDGIGLDRSLVFIKRNTMKNIYDDGIDIDEQSEAFLWDNAIYGVQNDGVLVSDASKAYIEKQYIEGANRGLTLRSGAWVFLLNSKIIHNNIGVVAYSFIPLTLNEEDFQFVLNRVSHLSQIDIDDIGFYTIKNGEEASKLLLSAYSKQGTYWTLIAPNLPQDLKNLFKLIDVFKLKDMNKSEEKKLLNSPHKNIFYLTNSYILGDKNDFYLKNPFYTKWKNVFLLKNKISLEEKGDLIGIKDLENEIMTRKAENYKKEISEWTNNFLKYYYF